MPLLTCQQDAYRRTMTVQVDAITAIEDGVEVLLSDTVLYPEGGGQPDDHGTINGAPVLGLRKSAGGIVHRLARAPDGERVEVVVDWSRRFDHMQQHTAQHLISAIAADRFEAMTTAFHLQPEVCDIALSRMLRADEVAALQEAVNAEIRADRPVRTRQVEAAALAEIRTRGLPEGLTGPIRLVEIEGIDQNTCGGTHVSSTAALQAVVLLPPQKLKGGCRLRYLAGDRVLQTLTQAHHRSVSLSRALSCGPDQHEDAIARIQADAAAVGREKKAIMLELAALLGTQLAHRDVGCFHREDADLGFLRGVASAAVDCAPTRTFLLTGGPAGKAGVFMLAGPADAVASLGPTVAAALQGRGGGARGRYQGRAQRLDLEAAAALLQEHDA